MIGIGSPTEILDTNKIPGLLASALDSLDVQGKRVLVIIPDSTRTAITPTLFRMLYDQIGRRVTRLDYLIALGTHPPMSRVAIEHLIQVSADELKTNFPNVAIYNHRWDQPDALETIGTISREETAALTQGLMSEEIPVRLNRMILDYDQLIICGPVFPHEVVGFSGGYKYLFPGIAGADIINATHWLGALVTSFKTIGIKDTPVRHVIHRAAQFVTKPTLCIAQVLKGHDLHGLYIGDPVDAWSAAADLSADLNIVIVPHAFLRVLSMPSEMYDDLWTAAKAMYKTEPAIAPGGEVVIYAPHLKEISVTHGKLIDQVGYHVKEYFTKQWAKFRDVPGTIKAHSTHVKGMGTYDASTCVETPRIQVTLATSIPEERCRQVSLGYLDYRSINPTEWAGKEEEGILLVPRAGEVLYRARDLM